MNLPQLRFAQALGSEGSFTAAAAACFVTQPTLSNGIAELEKELGQRLFTRTTRKVTLTDFGKHMLPAISGVLSAHETLLLHAKAYFQPQKRLIRVGTSPLISPTVLKAILEPFLSQNPGVNLIFREMNWDDLQKMLHEGLLDFIFGVKESSPSGRPRKMEQAFLYREPLLFIPQRFDWRGTTRSNSVSLGDIADETFVMVPDACGLAYATRALFRSNRRKIREYSGQALSYQVLEQWANLGIGAAVLPKSKVTPGADYTLAIIDKSGRPAAIEFEAFWQTPESGAAHLLAFARHLRKVVPALIAGLV